MIDRRNKHNLYSTRVSTKMNFWSMLVYNILKRYVLSPKQNVIYIIHSRKELHGRYIKNKYVISRKKTAVSCRQVIN